MTKNNDRDLASIIATLTELTKGGRSYPWW